jgi:hypothetical protein
MDSILETIEISIAVILFCIAVAFFIMLVKDIDEYTHEAFSKRTEIMNCSYLAL